MFSVDTFIDSVQSTKKYFVNNFIKDENVQRALNAFVETQTMFVKQIFRTNDVVFRSSMDYVKNLTKNDQKMI